MRDGVRKISDDWQLAGTDAIKLCGIDFKVNDLGLGRELRGLAGDAIIEACAENQKQISFVQRIFAARVPCMPTIPK